MKHKTNRLIASLTREWAHRCLLIIVPFALLTLVGCSDDSGNVLQESSEKGRIIAEEHIGDSVISLFDNVLVNLEPKSAQVGPSDTGGSGDDRWRVRISRTQNMTLKIEGLSNLNLSIQDSQGNTIATIFSGNLPTNVSVNPGTYQIVVRNEGNERVFFWTGWRIDGGTSEPGICAAELASAPPSAAIITPTEIPVFLAVTNPPIPPKAFSSYAEFSELFQEDQSQHINEAVRMYFLNGGGKAYIVGMDNASLEAHKAALSLVDKMLGSEIQIVVTPDAAFSTVSDWGAIVTSIVDSIAKRAMLIVDPPYDARELKNVPELRAVLPGEQSFAAVYFPWLINENGDSIAPSGPLAGLWCYNDATRGVWNAPANVAVVGVQRPEILLNDEEQGDLNFPVDLNDEEQEDLNGKAFNGIRLFPGRGTVVWGCRTLDGNSNDYQYIQVVRTLIYISQSLGLTLEEFQFSPNDRNTWTAIIEIFSNFLENLWAEGGLFGNTPSEAYSVECGLGSTMTRMDIINGKLIVGIQLQMIRPSEYIELIFEQQMPKP